MLQQLLFWRHGATPLDQFNNLVERSSASSKNTATDDLTQQVIPPEYEE